MRSSRIHRSGKKASSVSPASSPSSVALIRPHTRLRRTATRRDTPHSPICASAATTMNDLDFQSPPASPPSSDQQYSVDGDASPRSDGAPGAETSAASDAAAVAAVRRRRKRIAIELPPDQAGNLSKAELKKLKNRIAAARARERTQKQVEELEATVEQLWQENQQQQAVINHLRGLLHAQHQPLQPPASSFQGQHNAHTAIPVSYQDMLSADAAFLMPPSYVTAPHPFHQGLTTPSNAHYSDQTHHPTSTEGGDVHDGLMSEFSAMFPASVAAPPANY